MAFPQVQDTLVDRLAELRAGLEPRDPNLLASLTASFFRPISPDHGEFHLELWDRPVILSFPDFVAFDPQTHEPFASFQQALLLYYFTTCDGTPVSGRWISFSELPDGRFYNQAFQGYIGRPLVEAFHNDLATFCDSASGLGGMRVHSLGDIAYAFQALPLVALLVVAWEGDEDFSPTYQILFDANASHHLPTDVSAILGSSLTRRLVKAKKENLHLT
jgi:Domain of unknown function (DUF3786)